MELAEDHLGSVRFAATLTQNRPSDRVIGLHVLPDQELINPLITHEEADVMRKRVATDVTEILAREGLAEDTARTELLEDDEVERGLSEGAIKLALDGLIVGRRAKRDEDPIVRLGQVTRRILRRLPVPIMVVPPDYGSSGDLGLGKGPVILGTDLSDNCAAAARFAQDLATRLDRKLVLAHGTQAFHWGVSYIPAATMERLQEQALAGATAKMQSWASAQGITDAEHQVFVGDPVKHLLRLAYSEHAAVLVTGSRMLGPIERVFLASISSEVAAAAPCPVAVVPGK